MYSNLYPWTIGWGSGFFYSMAIGVLNLVYKMLISISAGGWEMDLTFISESIQRKEQLCFVRLRGNRLSNFEWVWVGATDQKFKLIFSFTTKLFSQPKKVLCRDQSGTKLDTFEIVFFLRSLFVASMSREKISDLQQLTKIKSSYGSFVVISRMAAGSQNWNFC